MNREETLNYLKGWQDAMEDISWEAQNYLPGADPDTGEPNGSVRMYGHWSGTNTASGKSFRGLWYHYFTFNEDGKIINGGDFGFEGSYLSILFSLIMMLSLIHI